MNIIFLTLYNIESLNNNGIYEDLLREFASQSHNVYVVSPSERRLNSDTALHTDGKVNILKIRTGNIQKTNILEKGISTLLLERQFIDGIKKYFSDVKFDLIMYSTPPITLAGVVKYLKKRDKAATYLMLKDIFPQNAVDIGLMSKSGVKGLIYRFFRNKEKQLYAVSDYIGCMSEANVRYLLKHNAEISSDSVGLCPNSIEPVDMSVSPEEIKSIRTRYGIPADKKVFVYGGNLGKPQGIPFLIDCLRSQKDNTDVFFLIVGDGTEYCRLSDFVEKEKPLNVRLMKSLPKDDYDKMIAACDVGLIFLDHRFTIPNFPSRLLSYMQAGLPVLAATDANTDVGKIIEGGEFGWWCESNDIQKFSKLIDIINSSDISEYKTESREYLCRYYSVGATYSKCFAPILDKINNDKC